MTELKTTVSEIAWQRTVEAEHAQSDSILEEVEPGNFWRLVAHKLVPPKKMESAH